MSENVFPNAAETPIASLMSYGLQTIEATARLKEISGWMRRVGHEGFPVVDTDGRIVGLLTRRDADRAAEHQLLNLRAQDIMLPGAVTITRSDSVATLIRRMVETGWWQIPVVNGDNQPIGIVTRTDVLKFWAEEAEKQTATFISDEHLREILGNATAKLIQLVSEMANEMGLRAYLVGGVVRDLLLRRSNDDIDFVVEGAELGVSARDLAHALAGSYGGSEHHHTLFGTSQWRIDPTSARLMQAGIEKDGLPEHIDLVSSRHEYYETPTALPTVYSSSIKLDLQRRDFTINTLAIQISPAADRGRLLDEFGGRKDLEHRLIRVLHSMSFVDDPTRILRAVRYATRLGFTIEPRTSALIDVAVEHKMLAQITGERLRNELSLLLQEDAPELGLAELERRGALRAIHPAFVLAADLPALLKEARRTEFMTLLTDVQAPNMVDLQWHLIGAGIDPSSLSAWCARLLIGKSMAESIRRTSELARSKLVCDSQARPSAVFRLLEGIPHTALCALWILAPDSQPNLTQYVQKWQYEHPLTTGTTLQELGLRPGRCFGILLEHLRNARLDGELLTADDELRMVRDLVEQGVCE